MPLKFTTKCTKILATVGPIDGNGNYENIEKIIKAGANGLRINFSHAQYDQVAEQIKWIREIAGKEGRNVSILADLQGPKIRFGELKDNAPYEVHTGDELVLAYGVQHDGSNVLPTQYDLSTKVKAGETVYLFDGKIRAEVVGIEGDRVKIIAQNDGTLYSRKGINLPDTDFSGDIITEKDRRDINFSFTQDFDYVSLSFVQSADDIRQLRQILKEQGSTMRIIPKIETKAAIQPQELEEIVQASDGVMVARGDLAYEVGNEVVPVVQRKIIELCQKHCKFSIVATQMMGSMVDNPAPTRAEVSDVATAAIEGADVVMLSEESAMGKYPSEAVAEMRKILIYIQDNMPAHAIYKREGIDRRRDALAMSAVLLAEQLDAAAIIVETRTGKMAKSIAIHRPDRRIIATSGDRRVAQQLPLIYGTRSYFDDEPQPDMGERLAERLYSEGCFGNDPVTVIITKSSVPSFDLAASSDTPTATDTIFVKSLGK